MPAYRSTQGDNDNRSRLPQPISALVAPLPRIYPLIHFLRPFPRRHPLHLKAATLVSPSHTRATRTRRARLPLRVMLTLCAQASHRAACAPFRSSVVWQQLSRTARQSPPPPNRGEPFPSLSVARSLSVLGRSEKAPRQYICRAAYPSLLPLPRTSPHPRMFLNHTSWCKCTP